MDQLRCCFGGADPREAGPAQDAESLMTEFKPKPSSPSNASNSAGASGSPPWMTALKGCGICVGVVVLLVLALAGRVATASCAIESFDHNLILLKNAEAAKVEEPFDIGTSANMNLTDLDIDLQGVWWMDGNSLIFEQLVSFASAEGKKPFPVAVPVYNNMKGRWTWSDNFQGRFVMAYYAFDASADTPAIFNFTNSSSANIVPVGGVFNGGNFGFNKINSEEWDRPDANYTLRRVVNADGKAGKFWNKFQDWWAAVHPDTNMLVWSSSNSCLRRCQYFAPCFVCNMFC